MSVQENVACARSLTELFNSRHLDPTWLEKSMSAFASDSTFTNVPLGITLSGPEGYKQFVMFFTEAFPDSVVEITNLFATEDQVVLEYTGRGNNTGPLTAPRWRRERYPPPSCVRNSNLELPGRTDASNTERSISYVNRRQQSVHSQLL
jgi:SnoaL-like polyketide cyclase